MTTVKATDVDAKAYEKRAKQERWQEARKKRKQAYENLESAKNCLLITETIIGQKLGSELRDRACDKAVEFMSNAMRDVRLGAEADPLEAEREEA